MVMNEIVQKLAKQFPVASMVQAEFEYALDPHDLDRLFLKQGHGYMQDLLFSQVVNLMSLVVGKMTPSVRSACHLLSKELDVGLNSVYEKLKRLQPETSAALVRHIYGRLAPVVDELGPPHDPLFEGYETRIVDGKHLDGSQRRLEAIRKYNAQPLPGQLLVTLDRERDLVCDVVACEDAHAQERKFFDRLLPQVQPGEVWIEDRNFCTTQFVFGVAGRGAALIVRRHKSTLYIQGESELTKRGHTDTGVVYEGTLRLTNRQGEELTLRRIVIELNKPTSEGDERIELLTNLPDSIPAMQIATGYRDRWQIEELFGKIASFLNAEMETLGYPKAALFAFCVALVSYNLLQTCRAALGNAHGREWVAANISSYYLNVEVRAAARTVHGLLTDTSYAEGLREQSPRQLAQYLASVAATAYLKRYPKSSRGPKKPPPRRFHGGRHRHISTHRKLQAAKGGR